MRLRSSTADRRLLAVGVVIAALVVFVCVNILTGAWLKSARLDLTQDRLYTLSSGTDQVLAAIDEPITLRLYRSAAINELGPYFANHARRVEEMLDEYERRADGMLRVQVFDPQAYSPEEDQAVGDGLRGIPLAADGSQFYFGLAGSNSTDDVQAIPYLAPERAEFLEYDLTRLVYDLAHPEKPKVAVIGSLPLMGDAPLRYQSWIVLDVMRQFFDVRMLGGSIEAIDDDVGILVIAQPSGLDERTVYAIDQFALRGGRILAFLDPAPEVMAAGGQPGMPPPGFAPVAPLLEAWGIEVPSDRVVGDRQTAARVQTTHRGRPVVTDYVAWFGVPPGGMAPDDVVLTSLERINLRSPGLVRPREDAGTTFQPLLSTSPDAMSFPADAVLLMPDPVALLERFAPEGQPIVVAARVGGSVQSAFPDGPPAPGDGQAASAAEPDTADHLVASQAPLNLIVVADTDLLADGSWLETGALLGQRYTVPTANNGDLIINALENLSGSTGLIALRGRGVTDRPFALLQAKQRHAEAEFQATERALIARIDETEQRIREIQLEEDEGGIVLTGVQQQTIDDFRREVLVLRQELRDVQHALRQEVEGIQRWVKILNIWTVPALITLFAVVLAAVRRRRAARRQPMSA